jgi:hypothetical protein
LHHRIAFYFDGTIRGYYCHQAELKNQVPVVSWGKSLRQTYKIIRKIMIDKFFKFVKNKGHEYSI